MRTSTRLTLGILGTLLGLLAAGATSARAADAFKVDPVHSMVFFQVKHFGVGHIYARFNQISGTFQLNDQNPADSSIEMQVSAGSIDSGNPKRDQHLRSPDFFNVKQFPDISFKSTQIKPLGDNVFEVAGDLTLLGVTKPIVTKVERIGVGRDMRGGSRSGIESTFTIKRSDFGMKFMVGPVGDEVRITVATEGTN
jgi:polyisoprenoid-binding protein YceI